MRKTPLALACLLVGACATPTQQTSGLDRNHDREQSAKIPKAPAFVQ